ncbi:MAG: NAD(P)/FAD-dependent oxidoreductase [Rhodocyclaceae bacterium]|nr:NAD(P)/FAD-dependent oxidoreductase [Rhodocyclaceae bacterium]
MNSSAKPAPRIVIIGAGFSGIGLAIYLQQAGIHDFVILEKAASLGGTWRENTYPGAECDVPSALYSFSFEHNAQWHYKWAEQAQILDYLQHVAEKHGLLPHMRFGRQVIGGKWDAASKQWQVQTADGGTLACQFLVTAVGQLHVPNLTRLPNAEIFRGEQFHSAQWRHDIDLHGKRVAVIGNAASAVQFIPQVAKQVARLSVFQRSPNWIFPKQDRPYAAWEQWLSDHVPGVAKLYRLRLWLRAELIIFPLMRGSKWLAKFGTKMTTDYISEKIADPELRKKLLPDYPIGAKRILFSDDYYDALARPNVELIATPIAGLTASGVKCVDGSEIEVDVVIYGTGFRTNPFLSSISLVGAGDTLLKDQWKDGAHAYLGISTNGFPNLFMMYGPNTNLGHNSIIIMSEAQARYIVQAIQGLDQRDAAAMDIKPEVESAFNDELQQRLATMIWSKVEASWYIDGKRITNNWAGSTQEYLRRCKQIDWGNYVLEKRA